MSVIALEQVRQHWKHHHDGDTQHAFPEGLGQAVKYVNWTAGALFFSGVLFATLFIIVNLNHQSVVISEDQMGKTITQDGAYVKTPVNTGETR